MASTAMPSHASVIPLVLANLLPLALVVLFDWDVAALMILYWSENLILGFYTLARMLLVSPLGGLGMAAFFCIHYGGFCAAHGLFLLTMLLDVDIDPIGDDPWPLFLVFVQMLVNVVREVLAQAPASWLWAFAALFVSHGFSFVRNFLAGGERDAAQLGKLMTAPYGRIMLLHVVVIAGGMLVMTLGESLYMLLLLVVLKIAIDVKLHLRERAKLAPVVEGQPL
ncbi:MAG: hypothetical protein HKN19_06490 [Halioglobus sp.]|nr:hypothetical protein [Halioglobus sp.]